MVLAIGWRLCPDASGASQSPATGRPRTRRTGQGGRGEWKEAQGVSLLPGDQERIGIVLSWHQVQTDEEPPKRCGRSKPPA